MLYKFVNYHIAHYPWPIEIRYGIIEIRYGIIEYSNGHFWYARRDNPQSFLLYGICLCCTT